MSIEVVDEQDLPVDAERLVEVARFVLGRLGVSPLADLSLAVVDSPTMAQLHERWMDLPGPTDVMAFPQDELDLRGSRGVAHGGARGDDGDEGDVPVLLGDVVVCPAVAEEQARTAGHTTADELDLLCTHGVLHLLGFDHAEPEEEAEMFALQGELLAAWRASRA